MILYEQGRAYWQVASRYHANRNKSLDIKPTAVRDMQRLQQKERSPSVLRRINSFISAHQTKPHRDPPNDDGPRYA